MSTRIRAITTATAALAALIAAPALAAQAGIAEGQDLAQFPIAAPGEVDRAADAARRARKRRERPDGPFHPLTVKPDYGDAQAAYGTARGRMHDGQDVFAPAGTDLIAVREGVVVEADVSGGGGNTVAIYNREHDETYVYLHMIAPSPLKAGDRVKAAQKVGKVGCTGSCWGDHLHFEIREGEGVWDRPTRNPLPSLERWKRAPKAAIRGAN